MNRSKRMAFLRDSFFRASLGLMIVAIALVATAAGAAALPYANFDGYATELVLVNPTEESIDVRIYGPQWPAIRVEPGALVRNTSWAPAGGGVAKLETPDGLVAKVWIRDPNGVIVPIGDVGPARETARFLEVLAGDGFVTYLFIHAETGTALQIEYESGTRQDWNVGAGGTIIVRVPDGETSAIVTAGGPWSGFYGKAPFRAFALIVRQPRGELFATLPY